MYSKDFNNPAPNLGFAWSPKAESGILGKVLGKDKTVIGGSYAINYLYRGPERDLQPAVLQRRHHAGL